MIFLYDDVFTYRSTPLSMSSNARLMPVWQDEYGSDV